MSTMVAMVSKASLSMSSCRASTAAFRLSISLSRSDTARSLCSIAEGGGDSVDDCIILHTQNWPQLSESHLLTRWWLEMITQPRNNTSATYLSLDDAKMLFKSQSDIIE